jgi:YD repeat-containing protein
MPSASPTSGLASSNVFNVNHRVTANHVALNLLTTYTYDSVGNLTAISYPSGPSVTFQYDAQQRAMGRSLSAAGRVVRWWGSWGC